MTEPIGEAVKRLRAWGEARDWQGFDPYDALNSPLARSLTLGTRLGRQLLTQGVKLSPVNLRPALLIKPAWNAKAIAIVASGYARLWAAHQDEEARVQARSWLGWLVENSTADTGLGWGYHFDVQTRFFAYRAETPNVIATSFAAHALLDGRELLGDPEWGEAAERACAYLMTRLLERSSQRAYFRYVHAERELVHNANVLGGSVCARTARLTGRDDLVELVRAILPATLGAQRGDGSWPYAEGEGHGWVDNFHTAYVLEALTSCEDLEPAIRPALERGFDFWERNLFTADGTPKYLADRLFPVDTHNHAQAIETWLAAASWREGAVDRARCCAEQLVRDWLEPDGHIGFQRRRFWTSRVPFVRWTTAPAFRALARLELVEGRSA